MLALPARAIPAVPLAAAEPPVVAHVPHQLDRKPVLAAIDRRSREVAPRTARQPAIRWLAARRIIDPPAVRNDQLDMTLACHGYSPNRRCWVADQAAAFGGGFRR